MSAAKAEPVIANTAATSTIFFIRTPNAFSKVSPDLAAPERQGGSRLGPNSSIREAIWYGLLVAGSKKDDHLHMF